MRISSRTILYAAFIRGVNVGRHRRIGNAQLRSLFEDVGFTDVAAFRTSGNVAFAAGREPVAKLAKRIEAALSEALGGDAVVFLRTAAQVRAVAAESPFPAAAVKKSNGKLQVGFLHDKPAPKARKEVLGHATDSDLLAFGERELYWLPSGGLLESALDLDAIDKLIGTSTRRTMGTVEQMAAKYFSAES